MKNRQNTHNRRGHSTLYNPDKHGFYATPEWVTRELLRIERKRIPHKVLEPACGDGAISRVLIDAGFKVTSSDLIDRDYGEVRNFFSITRKAQAIITNPPYALMTPFVLHSLKLAPYVAMVLPVSCVTSQERYSAIFRTNPPARIWVFVIRPTMSKPRVRENGSIARGKAIDYAWVIWDGDAEHTQLDWIPPR